MDELVVYLQLGVEHMLDKNAYDHILFVSAFALLYGFGDWKKLLYSVTAFTLGHSIALVVAVMGFSPLSSGLIELLIPVTIAILCIQNGFKSLTQKSVSSLYKRYWMLLFFGCIHGLGFSNYLKEILIDTGISMAIPLLGFNIGLEIAQLVVVILVLAISFVVIYLFQIKRKSWITHASAVLFGVNLPLLLEQLYSYFFN